MKAENIPDLAEHLVAHVTCKGCWYLTGWTAKRCHKSDKEILGSSSPLGLGMGTK